jgi:hypothetical protein
MKNVGSIDRIIRAVVGLLLIGLPLVTVWPIWTVPLAFWGAIVVGAVLVATSIFSFCPIYAALGLRTRPRG